MGSNGSGKSTFARLLNGLLKPSTGEVIVDGIPTSDQSRIVSVRRRVGLIFQDPRHQITSVTVERELAFGLQNTGLDSKELPDRVEQVLERFRLGGLRDRSLSTLSGGELQRVAVAAVMALRPEYLVLDEPTSLLSFPSRKRLLETLTSLRRETRTALIFITQFPDEAMMAERLLILHNGSIAFDDSPAQVFEKAASLKELGIAVPLRCEVEL